MSSSGVHNVGAGVDGKLKKKNRQNLVSVKIEEAFSKSATCDILGYYISEVMDKGAVTETNMEYLDSAGLHDFLYNRWKDQNGILQRFVEPKGVRNAVIRAIWSPKVCLLERRLNKRQLHDQRYGLYERAVTYEGPEHFSEAAPLRGCALPNQIQKTCETIETHVAEVSFQKHRVVRMVVNFKVDARDRVWLLWTSSIRLATETDDTSIAALATDVSRTPINIDSIVQLPSHVLLIDKANHSDQREATKPQTTMQCTSCGHTWPSSHFHPVQYKVIIAHFEQLVAILKLDAAQSAGKLKWPPEPMVVAAAGGVGFGCVKADPAHVKDIDLIVPPVIRMAHPNLTAPVFRKFRRDPLFLYKTVAVCETCFLAYAELATMPRSSQVCHPPGIAGLVPYGNFVKPLPPKPLVKRRVKVLPPATREPPLDHDSWMPRDAPSLPPAIFYPTPADQPLVPETQSPVAALSVEQREEASLIRRQEMTPFSGVLPRLRRHIATAKGAPTGPYGAFVQSL